MKNSFGQLIYFGRKLLFFLASVFLLSVAVFYISRLAPGDPLVSYYGDRVEKMSPEERVWAEEKLGLNDPIFVQYIRWLENAFHGDFGISYKYKMDVAEVISARIGNTLILGGIGFLLIFGLALLLGILCAWYEDRMLDRIICGIGTVTSCIPEFWLSLVLILIFAVNLKWLPSSGAYAIGEADRLGSRILHLILPMTVVVMGHLWYYAYMIRNKILEEVRADYVLLAKAKGLKKQSVMLRHCLRNVIPSYLSIMAISVPHILGGTYIVETVFSYPGIGTLSYESARYKDYNLVMLLCILSGIVVIFCNMAAQIINEKISPRMKSDAVTVPAEVTKV
ncbi:MAG: ABC transporter permease [Lachnospiraceae bacterium]|nr:ABC transporter permease [Lachnospiraceae bacterium]